MITQFILSHFPGVTEIEHVNPYAHCGPSTHELVQEQSTTQEFLAINGPLTLKLADNINVSPRTIYIRHFKNPNKQGVLHIRRLFSHAAAAQDDAMQDKIASAMGIVPGCYLHMPPETEGSVSVFVLREHPDSMYLQSPFIKTCLLLNETNLMNGILLMNKDFQKELPTRATVFDQKGEDISYDIDYYYFIPVKHVLSWCLTVGTVWRQKKGIFALEYTVAPKSGVKPYILYYAVDNHSFDRIKASFLKEFIHDKIDVRPVNSLGVELINPNLEQNNTPVSVTVSFTYAVRPRLTAEEQNALAPTLDPHFVPYSHILEKELKEVA